MASEVKDTQKAVALNSSQRAYFGQLTHVWEWKSEFFVSSSWATKWFTLIPTITIGNFHPKGRWKFPRSKVEQRGIFNSGSCPTIMTLRTLFCHPKQFKDPFQLKVSFGTISFHTGSHSSHRWIPLQLYMCDAGSRPTTEQIHPESRTTHPTVLRLLPGFYIFILILIGISSESFIMLR